MAQHSDTTPTVADRAGALLFALVAAAALFTFRDYGYSWDEVWQNRWYGQAVLRFLATFGADDAALRKHNFFLYGGAFDALAELWVRLSPLEPRNARHLANAAAGLAGLWGTRSLARAVGGPWAGFWAMLFLAVCAPFYGHMFINAKDIPFAAGYVWSLVFLHRVVSALPNPPLRDRLLLGLALGLTLGVRIGGVLILFYGALLAVLSIRHAPRSPEGVGEAGKPNLRRLAVAALPTLAVAYALMLAFWPAALLDPVAMPWEALRAATHFDWPGKVLWAGSILKASELPWTYLPVLFGVELPEVLALGLLPALGWAAFSVFRALRGGRGWEARGMALLLLAALFPPAWAILNRSTLYDNARHFLFVLPPLCCLLALGWAEALAGIERLRRGAGRLAVAALAAALALPTATMLSLHPYEYAYKNLFAGGVPEAETRFETDYWLTSYREAAQGLERHARALAAKAGAPFEQSRFTVTVNGPVEVLEEILPRQFVLVSSSEGVRTDYSVATTRWRVDRVWPEYPIVGTVGRRGMTFAVVKAAPDLAAALPSWDAAR